jgi:hypothetical protein
LVKATTANSVAAVKVRRLGRGPLQIKALTADAGADRTHHAGNPAGGIHDGGEHVSDGCLPIRAGYPDHR